MDRVQEATERRTRGASLAYGVLAARSYDEAMTAAHGLTRAEAGRMVEAEMPDGDYEAAVMLLDRIDAWQRLDRLPAHLRWGPREGATRRALIAAAVVVRSLETDP